MERWSRAALIASATGVLVLLLFQKVADFDVWFHLRAGEWLLHGGGFPRQDPFSFTAQQSWINLNWLYQVPLALIHRAAGVGGIVVANAVILLAAFGLIGRIGWRRGIPRDALVVILALAALACAHRMFVRPESASLLYLAVALSLTHSALEGRTRWLWGFIPLQLLWVNTEVLFPLGLCVLGAGSLQALWNQRRHRAPVASRKAVDPLKPWWLALAGGALAALANPYGARGAAFPLRMARLVSDPANIFNRGIFELKSPFDPMIPFGAVCFFFLFAAGVLAIVLWQRRRLDLFALLLLLGFGYLAFSSVRNIPLFAVAGSYAALRLWAPTPHAARPSRLRVSIARTLLAAAFLVLAIGIVTSGFYVTFHLGKRFGVSTDARYFPTRTLTALRQAGPVPRIMNDHALGHYLIWQLGPQTKVFLDGRSEVYGERLLSAMQPALADANIFDQYAERLGVTYALLGHRFEYLHPLLRGLVGHPHWKLIAYDQAALLLSRAPDAQPVQIPELPDSVVVPAPRRQGRLARWFAPASRDLADRHLATARILLAVGIPRASALEALDAARAAPWNADAFNQLGAALLRAGRFSAARQALAACLQIDPAYTEAMQNLGVANLAAGEPAGAETWLRRALARGAPEGVSRLYLGMALSSQRKPAEAEQELQRAAQLDPRDARPLFELARLLYDQGRYREAADGYRRAGALGETFRGLWGAAASLIAGGWQGEARGLLNQALQSAPDEVARQRVRDLLASLGTGVAVDSAGRN